MWEQLINDLGGTGAIADRLGLSRTRVSNWRKRGVPWRHRQPIADMAKSKRVALPADFLRPGA